MIQELQEKIRQTGLIPLSEKTLPFIKVGMYWYESGEFSEKLITGKSVKSVVLLVKGQTIYGDTFIEENVPYDKLRSLTHQIERKVNGLEVLIVPSVLLQEAIASSIVCVNESLALLNKDVWHGTYLTSSEYACYNFWTVTFPVGVKGFVGKGGLCKTRKILERYVI